MNATSRNLVLAALLVLFATALWVATRSGESDRDRAATAPTAETPATGDRVSASLAPPSDDRVAVEDTAPTEGADEVAPRAEAPAVEAEEGLSITGRVVMADGVGLGLVPVSVEAGPTVMSSQDEGRFRIGGLAPGEYRLSIGTPGSSFSYEVIGRDSFPAGASEIELVARACKLRVTAMNRAGGTGRFNRLDIAPILADGTLGPGASRILGASLTTTDVDATTATTLRLVADGPDGRLVGLIQTPPDGGALSVVLRAQSPSLATLDLVVGGALDSDATLVVELDNVTRGDLIEDELPLGARMSIGGLLSGEHRARFALRQPQGTSASETLFILDAPETIDVLGAETMEEVLQLAPGGQLSVEVWGDLEGIAPDARPVEVGVTLTRVGDERPLDVVWRGWHGGAATATVSVGGGWQCAEGLAPDAYSLRFEAPLFEVHEEPVRIDEGQLTELRVDLRRR